MKNDPWLDKWIPLLKERSANGFILELGCGNGWDTLGLLNAGLNVIASDLSTRNLRTTQQASPHTDIVQLDNGKPFPFASHSIDVILASLSLHYFPWTITLKIASELHRIIKPGGILLARFNSTNDHHYGAASELEIEPNFYHVQTSTKRFFDETAVRTMFQGWEIKYLEENIIHRYEKPKSVWELMAFSPVKETCP